MVVWAADGDDADRQQQKTERAKRRALGSSLMRELRSEHDDAPHEIHVSDRHAALT